MFYSSKKITVILLSTLLSFISHATTNIEAAYVLYGQATDGTAMPMARVIIDGLDQTCPDLISNDGGKSPVKMSLRVNPNKSNFPVTVCEAIYPYSTAMHIANTDVKLPSINKDVTHVNVFGDTGCKPSDQDCSINSKNWPFPTLVKAAAQSSNNADVILHMGDYNYSGTPGNINIKGMQQKVSVYDAGDNTSQGLCHIPGAYYGQNTIGSEFPDSWKHWASDFFNVAKPLFSQSPWIFARGNHELCSRAGLGWFYFLDPNSTLLGKYQAQLSCPLASNPTPTVLSPPYLVSFPQLNIAVLDSANACDYGQLNSDNYLNQYSMLQHLIKNADKGQQTWLQMHRPLWGVDSLDDNGSCGGNPSDKYCYVNQTMQSANHKFELPKSVNLIVSGHMHRFQVTDFNSKKHADQLVVGNSGVKLSRQKKKKTTKLKINGHKAIVIGLKQFGYMNISISDNNWVGQLLNPELNEPVLIECDSIKKPMCKKTKRNK